MRNHVLNFLLFVSFFAVVALLFNYLVLGQANGYTDSFYLRFTTPKQQSLILGTSRSAQGFRPDIIEPIIGQSIYNYSFTVGTSIYGPTYLESIKRKVDRSNSNGIFILGVDPWSISSTAPDPNDIEYFRENNSFLNKVLFTNLDPNFNYLYLYHRNSLKTIVSPVIGNVELKDDGWLDVKNIPMDSLSVCYRLETKIHDYLDYMYPNHRFSNVRLFYLQETIRYLSQFGQVFLVRLPIHPRLMEMEQAWMPKFNDLLTLVSKTTNAAFMDLTPLNKFGTYTDGNHIYREFAEEVSCIVAEWIRESDTSEKNCSNKKKR